MPFNLPQRLPVYPLNAVRINVEDEELWRHGETMSPGWRQLVRTSSFRFSRSNRFDDAGNRHLTVEEVESVLAKLTPEVYKPTARSCNPCGKSKESSGENNHICSICLEDFVAKQQLYRLPCLHRFHANCLKPWIVSNGQCPVCRFDLTGRPQPGTNEANNVPVPHLPVVVDMTENSSDEIALFLREIEEALARR